MLVGEKDKTGKVTARAPQCDYWNCSDEECQDTKRQYDLDIIYDEKTHPNESHYPTIPSIQSGYDPSK